MPLDLFNQLMSDTFGRSTSQRQPGPAVAPRIAQPHEEDRMALWIAERWELEAPADPDLAADELDLPRVSGERWTAVNRMARHYLQEAREGERDAIQASRTTDLEPGL